MASLTETLAFLDVALDAGAVSASRARLRRAAMNAVASVLTEDETDRFTTLDFEEVIKRLARAAGEKYTSASLASYKSRIRNTISDFDKFRKFSSLGGKPHSSQEYPRSGVLILPLRDNVNISISGIPRDINAREAKMIANVVAALVVEN